MPDDEDLNLLPSTPVDDPPHPPPVVNTEPELTPQPAPDVPRWLYTGPPFRTYANVPVTVNPGDILRRRDIPADDGNWQPTDAEPTVRPDNWRDDPQPGFGQPLRAIDDEEEV